VVISRGGGKSSGGGANVIGTRSIRDCSDQWTARRSGGGAASACRRTDAIMRRWAPPPPPRPSLRRSRRPCLHGQAKYIVMNASVCLPVSLSLRFDLRHFCACYLCSWIGGVAMRCVLPVSRMTSHLHAMGHIQRCRRCNTGTANQPDSLFRRQGVASPG